MKCPTDLLRLLKKYEHAAKKEDLYIKKLLKDTVEQFEGCEEDEYYYADGIARNLCRVIEIMEKTHAKEMEAPKLEASHSVQYMPNHENVCFTNSMDLMQAFYNHFKDPEQVDYLDIGRALESGQKELVNPTMKDYVARIYTFSGPKYLDQLFSPQVLGDIDPVLFVYENIELILATFKTRDNQGNIIKQNVNLRSALRKLNEFKQAQAN